MLAVFLLALIPDVAEAHSQSLRIQHPAPSWTADALVNGEFKKVSLEDYLGGFR